MRSKLLLGAALVMGIVTTVLFFNYINRYETARVSAETMVGVLAAKQDIAADTKLNAGMLQLLQVPASSVHAQALTDPVQAEGKVAAVRLVPGEMLMPHHLRDTQAEALFVSKKVREGYRAMSVGVNLVQSVSNLVEPGDYVDLVYTREEAGTTKQLTSTLLLENVRVLAIGRRMVEARPDTPYAEYASVTLEVRPEEGVNVVEADERGSISLLLHGRTDENGAKPGEAGEK